MIVRRWCVHYRKFIIITITECFKADEPRGAILINRRIPSRFRKSFFEALKLKMDEVVRGERPARHALELMGGIHGLAAAVQLEHHESVPKTLCLLQTIRYPTLSLLSLSSRRSLDGDGDRIAPDPAHKLPNLGRVGTGRDCSGQMQQ